MSEKKIGENKPKIGKKKVTISDPEITEKSFKDSKKEKCCVADILQCENCPSCNLEKAKRAKKPIIYDTWQSADCKLDDLVSCEKCGACLNIEELESLQKTALEHEICILDEIKKCAKCSGCRKKEICYPEINLDSYKGKKRTDKYCDQAKKVCEEGSVLLEEEKKKEKEKCQAEIKPCVDNKFACNKVCRKCPACRKVVDICIEKEVLVKETKPLEKKSSLVECGICEVVAKSIKPCNRDDFCKKKNCGVAKVYDSFEENKITDQVFPTRCCYKTIILNSTEVTIDEEGCPLGGCGPQTAKADAVRFKRKVCRGGNYCASDVDKKPCGTVKLQPKTASACSKRKCVDECTVTTNKSSRKAQRLKDMYNPDVRTKFLFSDRPLFDAKPVQVFEKYDGEKRSLLYKYPVKGVCPNCQGLNLTDKLCYDKMTIKEEKIDLPFCKKFFKMFKQLI